MSVAARQERAEGGVSALMPTQPRPGGAINWFWRLIGYALFGVGFLGIFLPVLPTVPFWILAVLALRHADPALAARIRAWPGIGAAVSDFLDHGIMARRAKIWALLAMAASAGLAIWRLEPGLALYAALGLLAIGAIYVASRPERL